MFDALATLVNNYNNSFYTAADGTTKNRIVDTYIQEAIAYQTTNTNANYQQMTAYAFLKLYGSAVNLHFASPNTTTFKPLEINTNNTLVTKPCP